jgi:uncharacterized protein YbaA (DUF1428 family)
MKTNLCVFLPSGRTYSFKNVIIVTDNETVIVFSYAAMSDGKTKRATFYKNMVAGISTYMD